MYNDVNKKSYNLNNAILSLVVIISIVVSVLIMIDGNKPSHYSLLFLLPLIFGVMSLVCKRIYYEVPDNLGFTILIVLTFVRLVISPFCMLLGNYEGTIVLNVEYNTPLAIFLVLYETFAIFLLLYFQTGNEHSSFGLKEYDYNKAEIKTYSKIVFVCCTLLAVCLIVTPQLAMTYRTLINMGDTDFTSHEDAYIVAIYGTTFIKKLSLVTGQYLARGLIVLVPALLIARLSKNKSNRNHILSLLCTLIPLFFVGGAIARSLIYVICLYVFYNYLFFGKLNIKTIAIVICLAGVAVIAWWIFRSDGVEVFEQFSRRFSAYFSGVNVVSGVENLPNSYGDKAKFFLYDILGSIPYGGTIFNLSSERVQAFFNNYNFTQGQIPPTIAMSYYYFGLVLSPVYSLLFAYIAIRAGKKLKEPISGSRMKYIRLVLSVFYFSMGIVMYNIEIVMSTFFSLILPLYVFEKLSYRGD